jgi:glucose-6-phosphate isomerase
MDLFNDETRLKAISPTETKTWKKLQAHFLEMKSIHMRELFANDSERFSRFSIRFNDILLDYSKNLITEKTMQLLYELAFEVDLKDAIEKMFSGEKINETENRAVLHTALRNSSEIPIFYEGKNVMSEISAELKKIKDFSDKVISGLWLGYSGKPITDIVNIGIGGSDLGPFMVTGVLKPYNKININTHFVSNVDGTDIVETLKYLNPETTLFFISSKTFTTVETMTNASTAKSWFLRDAPNVNMLKQHFIAISTNLEKVTEFGIDPENIFIFWDWVGGRFSLWSAIGLSIACSIGYENFAELLKGAMEMDNHFRNSPFDQNIPVIMALLSVWYNNFFAAETEAFIAYDQYLYRFTSYLQQLGMESNGKSIDRNGRKINYQTAPIIWGKPGTNGQHAFFQLLHQGTKFIPCDFVATAISKYPIGDHHQILMANFFAQTEALMKGKTESEVRHELEAAGLDEEQIKRILPHKVFAGNHPSNSILIKRMTPHNLGALISLYEHKTFVQGIIWNIFSFDQWGVELGKVLAKDILTDLSVKAKVKTHDSSTNGLINAFKDFTKDITITKDSGEIATQGFSFAMDSALGQLSDLQYKILEVCREIPSSSSELVEKLHRRGKSGNLKRAISALKSKRIVAYTIPDIPGSPNQKYKLTRKGSRMLDEYFERKKVILNRIQIIKGDITNLKVDAIVNAANTSLRGGGGVDGAIHRAAGENLKKECLLLGGCPTGEARLTGGYQLPAKFVIHAVGPVWHGGRTKEKQLLAGCYRYCLELAVKNGIRTIAFPAISCGIYRFPVDIATTIAVQEVKAFLETDNFIEKVIFSCFTDEIYNEYLTQIQNNV